MDGGRSLRHIQEQIGEEFDRTVSLQTIQKLVSISIMRLSGRRKALDGSTIIYNERAAMDREAEERLGTR